MGLGSIPLITATNTNLTANQAVIAPVPATSFLQNIIDNGDGVLPEGVLNNAKQMVTVRDYFEGKAKLINITSIPQDVFIASGATVKPSLLFLKKFYQRTQCVLHCY